MLPRQRDTIITTPRLAIAPVVRGDFEDWANLRRASAAHLKPWEPSWGESAHSKADWAQRLRMWSRGWNEGRMCVFLVRDIETGKLLGGVSLTNIRGWPSDSASLGYWLGKNAEGHGYMQEAVRGVCHWAFTARGLLRLEAGTLPENARSRRVLENLGFKEEGLARAYLEINGQRRDHVLYGLVTGELTL